MNPVVHFEMPYENRDRAADFYVKAFGWQNQKYGEEMGNYLLVHTTETDANGMVKKPGTINGGLYQKPEDPADPAGQHPSVVIAVDNITEAIQKVNEAGGKVLGEPMEIPGIGLYAGFLDTEGNRVSMLQPSSSM